MDTGIVIGPVPGRHRLGLPLGGLRDDALARRVSHGDDRAFTEIHRRYHATLYRYCRSIVRHEQDAQDALQATLISAYGALREARRDAPLRPWLFRIAHNESISVLRRRRPEAELSDELPARAGVEETADARERMSQLVADLGSLPERQRSALIMRELNGLPHEEIAAALSTTPAAAKQTIFEARRALADLEAGRAMSCDEICRVISDGDRRSLRGRKVRAHLRGCQSCADFADAIGRRTSDLRALAPMLPPAAGSLILSRVLGGAGHGVGGTGSAAAAAGPAIAGTVTKAVVAGAVLAGGVAGYAHIAARPHHPATHPAAPGDHWHAARERPLAQPHALTGGLGPARGGSASASASAAAAQRRATGDGTRAAASVRARHANGHAGADTTGLTTARGRVRLSGSAPATGPGSDRGAASSAHGSGTAATARGRQTGRTAGGQAVGRRSAATTAPPGQARRTAALTSARGSSTAASRHASHSSSGSASARSTGATSHAGVTSDARQSASGATNSSLAAPTATTTAPALASISGATGVGNGHAKSLK